MTNSPSTHIPTTVARRTTWFAGIDSLRFALALIVMFGHCQNPIVDTLKNSGVAAIRYAGLLLGVSFVGIVAVIAFFVISGFVIHYPHQDKPLNLKRFFTRRYTRVLLPLVVVMLAGIPFGSPEVSVVWSLYCELIFYTLYPVLRAIDLPWSTKTALAFVVCVVVIVVGARFDIQSMLHQTDINYHGEYWQLGNALTWLVGLPCWLLGVELASRIDTVRQRVSDRRIVLLTLLAFGLMVMTSVLRFHFFVSNIISMTLIAIPLAKWIEYEIVYYRNRRPNAFLERCGKFSYSLYLSHPLVLAILYLIIPLNVYSYAGYIVLVVASAYVVYQVLERPAHTLAQRLSGSSITV